MVLKDPGQSGRVQDALGGYRTVWENPESCYVLEKLIIGFKTVIKVMNVPTIKDVMRGFIVLTNQFCYECHGFQECHYSYRISLALQACLDTSSDTQQQSQQLIC